MQNPVLPLSRRFNLIPAVLKPMPSEQALLLIREGTFANTDSTEMRLPLLSKHFNLIPTMQKYMLAREMLFMS